MKRLDVHDAAIICRGLGHAWDEYSPATSRVQGRGWRLHVRCVRCHTERHDLINVNTGDLDRRSYHYPKEYKIERPPANELRLEMRIILKAYNNERSMLRSVG